MLNVTSESTPHTLDSAEFITVDAATQTIDTFNRYSYVANGTLALNFSEAFSRKAAFYITRVGTANAGEARKMGISAREADGAEIDENAGKNIAITRISGTLNASDFSKFQAGVHASDSLSLASSVRKQAKTVLADGAEIDDSPRKGMAVYKTGTAKANETGTRGIGVNNTEPLKASGSSSTSVSVIKRADARFMEYAYRDMKLSEVEAASLAEADPVWNMGVVRKDVATVSETVKKGAGKLLAESAKLSDVMSRSIAANRQESLSIAMVQGRQSYITAAAMVEVSEFRRKRIEIRHTESVSASETNWKDIVAVMTCTLAINENLNRTTDFNKWISERMNTAETPYKTIAPKYSEGVEASELKRVGIGKNEEEGITYDISIDRVFIINANFIESISLAVDAPKEMETIYTGGITAKDVRVLANPGAILSDIYVGRSGITLSDFEEMAAKPAEYTPFTEFKVGEYEYQDAMYRMVIRKDNTAANPLVYGYAVHVDIDDVKDRGTAAIKAEETKVYFNRTYYTTPDVVVNVVGGVEGETVTPVITGEGKDDAGRYFTVVLKNSSGTAVAGTITWNSNGY